MPSDASAREWIDDIPGAPPFKYCRRTSIGSADQPSLRIPGVALLLPEQHANINVGHQAKDLVFLAHVLVEQRAAQGTNGSFTLSTVLIDDRATATGNISHQQGFRYRREAIDALVGGHSPPVHVTFLQQGAMRHREDFAHEPPWSGAKSVCFDVLLQKGFSYAGDWRAAELFRERVYAKCGIASDGVTDAVLILVHGTASNGQHTRRWADQPALVASVKARRFRTRWCGGAAGDTGTCAPLRVLVRAMEGLSFCQQAALFARSKVVVTHHGASLANGYFLRPDSLMVELNRQWRPNGPGDVGARFAHPIENAGYAGLFASSHVPYVGARVTYGVWPRRSRRNDGQPDAATGAVSWSLRHPAPYDFTDPHMAIGVNASRWADVLDEVDEMVITLGNRRPVAANARNKAGDDAPRDVPPAPPPLRPSAKNETSVTAAPLHTLIGETLARWRGKRS